MYTWWKVFGKGSELLVLLVHDGDHNLVGIAPLYVEQQTDHGFLPMRTIKFLGTNDASSEYLGFIIKREAEQEVTNRLLQFLLFGEMHWDKLMFSDMLCSCNCTQLLYDVVMCFPGYLKVVDKWDYPLIKLPQKFSSYVDSLSKSLRRNLRYTTNKLNREFVCEFDQTFDVEEVRKIVAELFRLHELRCLRSRRNSSFISPEMRAFHMKISETFFHKGWLRLYYIKLNQEIQAVAYGFLYGKTLFGYQLGFNPEFISYSLGNNILLRTVEDSIQSECENYDFLRGSEKYKHRWTNSERQVVDVVVYASHTKGAACYFILQARKRASRLYHRAKHLVGD